jgi:hypothetical protein
MSVNRERTPLVESDERRHYGELSWKQSSFEHEQHDSTEHLMEKSSTDIFKTAVYANYISEVKSHFFSLGFISGASLQMFAVTLLLMFASYSNNAGSLVELRCSDEFPFKNECAHIY